MPHREGTQRCEGSRELKKQTSKGTLQFINQEVLRPYGDGGHQPVEPGVPHGGLPLLP